MLATPFWTSPLSHPSSPSYIKVKVIRETHLNISIQTQASWTYRISLAGWRSQKKNDLRVLESVNSGLMTFILFGVRLMLIINKDTSQTIKMLLIWILPRSWLFSFIISSSTIMMSSPTLVWTTGAVVLLLVSSSMGSPTTLVSSLFSRNVASKELTSAARCFSGLVELHDQ